MALQGHLLQFNLNHSAKAQDFFTQTMAECNIGLVAAAEPYRIPDCPVRVGNELGSIAIARKGTLSQSTFQGVP
ncbi:hypothetical protein QLX08_009219 [Tetragonisca angustula]|uniref:Uncharacterized protein n=1 Tax=Tetragonisca angustula TaxID=166442 RepID=A0AAW0ZHU7_9HYME